jgi:hypothetical protein
MIQGLIRRSRDLDLVGNIPLKLIKWMEEEVATGAISFPQGGPKTRLTSGYHAEKRDMATLV